MAGEKMSVDGMSGGQGSMEEGQSSLHDILTNQVVGGKVIGHLSLADMKSLSEVNREICKDVRSTRRFQETAVLIVSYDSLELLDSVATTEFSWSEVRIDVTLSLMVLEKLKRILESAEFVSLVWMTRYEEVDEMAGVDFILCVLSSSPKLSHLHIDLRVWNEWNLRAVFMSRGVQEILKNLKGLELLTWNYKLSTFLKNEEEEATYLISGWGDTNGHFSGNLVSLVDLLMTLESLETLKIAKVKVTKYEYQQYLTNQLQDATVGMLVNLQGGQLRELSVHFDAWESQEFGRMRFPQLKTLTATFYLKNSKTFVDFLGNHPELEELSVGVEGTFPISRTTDVIKAIEGVSGNLRKLHVKAKRFFWECDWRFLEKMSRLKDFRVCRPHKKSPGEKDLFGSGATILTDLPKGQLESLDLKGLKTCGFWVDKNGECLELQRRIGILQGFACVRRLVFNLCLNSADDVVMQFILKEFKSLEELEVTHCEQLTDGGFSGEDVSVANVRGLKSLTIIACPLVTPEGVLAFCVSLSHLKSLEYLTLDPVNADFVLRVVEQNGTLESVHVNLAEAEKGRVDLKSLKEKNPRMQRFILTSSGNVGVDEDSEADRPYF